jgi:hypothetical protein
LISIESANACASQLTVKQSQLGSAETNKKSRRHSSIIQSDDETLRFSFISNNSRFSTTTLNINPERASISTVQFSFDSEIETSKAYLRAGRSKPQSSIAVEPGGAELEMDIDNADPTISPREAEATTAADEEGNEPEANHGSQSNNNEAFDINDVISRYLAPEELSVIEEEPNDDEPEVKSQERQVLSTIQKTKPRADRRPRTSPVPRAIRWIYNATKQSKNELGPKSLGTSGVNPRFLRDYALVLMGDESSGRQALENQVKNPVASSNVFRHEVLTISP